MTDLECFLYDLNRVGFGYEARPAIVETAIGYIYDEIAEPDTSGLGAIDRDGDILDGPERAFVTDTPVDDMFGAHDTTTGIGRALRPETTKPAVSVEEVDVTSMFGAH